MPPCNKQRQLDVLRKIEHGHEVERLKDEPQLVQPQPGEILFAQVTRRLPVDAHRAAGRRVDAADLIEQGRLSAARRPRDGDELPALDRQRHPPQRVHRHLAERVFLHDVFKLHDRRHEHSVSLCARTVRDVGRSSTSARS
jgi:hypothetical protein